jgi:hypothetical protein
MPGKEVWITEWGAFEPASTLGDQPATFDGMWLHMIARGMLAQLRHKEVTVSTPHALFAQGNLMSAFRRASAPDQSGKLNDLGSSGGPGGGYVPINFAGVVAWFCEASRGPDAHYQRITVQGAQRIRANGTIPGEGFNDVDACLIRKGPERTLFIHNAWKTPARVDLSGLGVPAQARAEAVETPNVLASLQAALPAARPLAVGAGVTAPAHSLARIRWRA